MSADSPVAILYNSGGTEVGTSGAPLRTDPTGATAQPVSGPLTDAQLRATAVPVSGPVTDAQLRATAVPVSGPLTDAQLRATSVPVSGPLTDTQLRATAVPVSAAALPLPTGAATSALQTTGNGSLASLDSHLPAPENGRVPVALAPVSAATVTLVAASETSVTALAANTARKGAILLNHSQAMCYVKFGSGAGLEDFTFILGPHQGITMECRYTGIVTAIWQKAVGGLHVTELT